MTFGELRLKHPRFIYKSFDAVQKDSDLRITFHFELEPGIEFAPETRIPLPQHIDINAIKPYLFNLGMIEAISYWKAACPAEFMVEAGALSREETRFWYDLIIHGLGEFFYKNTIDFTQADFLKIESTGEKTDIPTTIPDSQSSDLVLVGGGKDSSVTLGILTKSDRTLQILLVNPTQAALDVTMTAGISSPIIVEREIDPRLLELNENGYLNGHTPFNAYLAFLGTLVAALYGNENVIVSNERSANEGNVTYQGMEINHQYSKSLRFETMFRKSFFSGYFSFLRPLSDMQIAKLFSHYPKFFPVFRSCNVGSKTNSWCGTCPKCAFTYLTLFPFLAYEDVLKIFGSDYFTSDAICREIRGLTGLTPVKPFECVGTRDEAKLAVTLSVEAYEEQNREIPEGLLKIKSDLSLSESEIARLKATLNTWGDTYNLPPEHLAILRDTYERT